MGKLTGLGGNQNADAGPDDGDDASDSKAGFAKKMILGAVKGGAQGMQRDAQNAQRGGGVAIAAPEQAQVNPGDPNYLAQFLRPRVPQYDNNRNSAFYGG